jgi:hypothetical protein
MVLYLLLTAVRRNVVLGVRGEFNRPLAFDDRRALDLRGDREYRNSHYLEGTTRAVADAKENSPPTLGKTCQGKNGVNNLGLKLGI